MDPEFTRIDRLVHSGADPEVVWLAIRDYLERNGLDGSRWAEVATPMEDLIFLDADRFIARIEQAAESSPAFRSAIGLAEVGGIGGPSVERFIQLQEGYGRRPP